VNRDGRIDLIDLVLVAIHYGETRSTSANPSAGSDYTVYITETGTKYHKAGCRYLKESAIPILKSEAIKKGYTPCSVCKP